MNHITAEALNLALKEVIGSLREYVEAKSAETLTPDELVNLEDEAVVLREIAKRLKNLVDHA